MKTAENNHKPLGAILEAVPVNYNPEKIMGVLKKEESGNYPIIVRILMVIGAWIGAFSLSAFLIFFLLKGDEAGMIGLGSVFIITGLALSYINVLRVALDAFGLALTVIGIAVLMAGVEYDLDNHESHNLVIAGIELFIAVFTRSKVQRTVGVFGFFSFTGLFFYMNFESPAAVMILFSVCALLITLLHAGESWMMQHAKKFMSAYQPVLSGLVLSLAGLSIYFLIRRPEGYRDYFNPDNSFYGWWPAAIPAAILLLGMFYQILKSYVTINTSRLLVILLLVLLCIAPMLKAPGIITALLLICCGFYAGQKITWAIGMLLLIFHCIAFYYLMETTLLTKSILMMVSGALLIGGSIMFHILNKRS